ncbi:MAG: cyclic nucleotide-binding domain-containing protein [bacterium]|nr:cyclic nucleotide-binding domain-containing protein [bacterium]
MNIEAYEHYQQQLVKSGTVIFQEHDTADGMYVIIRGRITISKQVMAGLEKTLNTLEEGEYFGEMSLLLNATRSATATALEDSTLIKLSREEFKQVLKNSPEAGMTMLTQLARRLDRASRENILLALELALLEQAPPERPTPLLSRGQILIATGSFALQDLQEILRKKQSLNWAPETNELMSLLKPSQEEDALVYVIQTNDSHELLKLSACFQHLVHWKISPALYTSDPLPEDLIGS